MAKSKVVCSYWKFAHHDNVPSVEFAMSLAKRIEEGEFVPTNNCGERYFKSMGWCFDVGRKPYLIQYAHGEIHRSWAMSVAELRESCGLSRRDKVVQDPFQACAH